jgi:hypothetical protein
MIAIHEPRQTLSPAEAGVRCPVCGAAGIVPLVGPVGKGSGQ